MTEPSIALIGCGAWGKNHARILGNLGVLRCVYDDNPSAYPSPCNWMIAPTLKDILGDAKVNGVVIATPPDTHFDIARKCLLAGKDVLIEKPMTTDTDDAKSLIALAKRKRRVILVGHLMLYHPGYQELRKVVRAGKIGIVEYIYSNRLQPGKIRMDVNSLWSLAPHDFSMMTDLIGLPKTIACTGSNFRHPEVADIVTATMDWGKSAGVRGHLFVSWLHHTKERTLYVIGSKGAISLHESAGGWSVNLNGNTIESGPQGWALVDEIENFLHCIETREEPIAGGRGGLEVVRCLTAADESMSNRGRSVAV